MKEDWGKEVHIGNVLARDLDLYRAITCYKRALILMPHECRERRLQAEYALAYSYYLGRRYCEFLETVELGSLFHVPETFPPFREMALMLYDSYLLTEQKEKAECISKMIEGYDPAGAENLKFYTALIEGDMPKVTSMMEVHPCKETLTPYMAQYFTAQKSVRKAQVLNALLPGAGYYYVGQTKSAITSFILNALFIAATVQFAERGYIPAALITASFEMGWYVGGINGAGLAAKEFNERLYEYQAKEMMIHHRLFPMLMLQTAF